jgi:PilZ domain-containing protein
MAILTPGAPTAGAPLTERPAADRRIADRRGSDRRASERRTSLRRPLDSVPSIAEVRVQSKRVDVIDVSAGGLLIVGSQRLLPGVPNQLEIVLGSGPLRVSCRVIRSEVAQLSLVGIQYRSAIAFDQRLDFIDDPPVEAAPGDLSAIVIYSGVMDAELEEHLALNGW